MPDDADHAAAMTPASSTPPSSTPAATTSQAPAAPSPDIPSIVDQDFVCANCSYNLRGLPATGNCPECATPILTSFQGFLLEFADRSYLADLQRGAAIIFVGSIGFVVLMIITIGASMSSTSGPWLIVSWITLIVGECTLVGVWLYTRPDPRIDEHGAPRHAHVATSFRKLTRLCAVVVGAWSVLLPAGIQFGLPVGLSDVFPILVLPIILGIASMLFCMLIYTRSLARRIPDPGLVRACGVLAWCLPLMIYPGGVLLIGPTVAFILCLVLLHHVRLVLKNLQSRAKPASEVH